MSKVAPRSLEDQVSSLARQVRTTRQLLLATVALSAVPYVVGMGQSQKELTADRVVAGEFVVVHSGKEMAALTNNQNGGSLRLHDTSGGFRLTAGVNNGAGQVVVNGEGGRVLATVGASSRGSGFFRAEDFEGRHEVSLGATGVFHRLWSGSLSDSLRTSRPLFNLGVGERGAALSIYDDLGPVCLIGQNPIGDRGVIAYNKTGGIVGVMGGSGATPFSGLLIGDGKSGFVGAVGLNSRGGGALVLLDGGGKPAANVNSDERGGFILLQDPTGQRTFQAPSGSE